MPDKGRQFRAFNTYSLLFLLNYNLRCTLDVQQLFMCVCLCVPSSNLKREWRRKMIPRKRWRTLSRRNPTGERLSGGMSSSFYTCTSWPPAAFMLPFFTRSGTQTFSVSFMLEDVTPVILAKNTPYSGASQNLQSLPLLESHIRSSPLYSR